MPHRTGADFARLQSLLLIFSFCIAGSVLSQTQQAEDAVSDIAGLPVIQTAPLRFGVAADGGEGVPTIQTAPLRFGVAADGGEGVPTIQTAPLRFGVATDGGEGVPTIQTAPLRFGVAADGGEGVPTIQTAPLRFGVAADGGEGVPTIQTAPLRFGVAADGGEGVPTIQTAPLRFGTVKGDDISPDNREVEFRLVRVTSLDPNNAIDPFDYRDVIGVINNATRPDTPAGRNAIDDQGGVGDITINGVPVPLVFGTIGLQPMGSDTSWLANSRNTSGNPPPLPSGSAAGFYSEFSGGLGVRFVTGQGWSSSQLPLFQNLPGSFPDFGTVTVTFEVTRDSDGSRFSLTLTASAGSDGDVELINASGFACSTGGGSCP
ncbi:hypothetical protein J2T55_001381 [Methylohalomonas lacus]|uniref:Uncharacterized protein n=1 Tax=Methylohalomonas lacus TaxID=398773 RepID=A0AAE3HJC6_9GAMM|nr:hypothetical protein [Methylohalomonas lacus]MCS3903360.1 hypothetical protein [Methylohalomonas lacus]